MAHTRVRQLRKAAQVERLPAQSAKVRQQRVDHHLAVREAEPVELGQVAHGDQVLLGHGRAAQVEVLDRVAAREVVERVAHNAVARDRERPQRAEEAQLGQIAHARLVEREHAQLRQVLEVEQRRRRDLGALADVERAQHRHAPHNLGNTVVVDLGAAQAELLKLGEAQQERHTLGRELAHGQVEHRQVPKAGELAQALIRDVWRLAQRQRAQELEPADAAQQQVGRKLVRVQLELCGAAQRELGHREVVQPARARELVHDERANVGPERLERARLRAVLPVAHEVAHDIQGERLEAAHAALPLVHRALLGRRRRRSRTRTCACTRGRSVHRHVLAVQRGGQALGVARLPHG
eukprot:Unigene2580_Nuclearia_a/m.7964 Unigene2580_Nuclearia_a/g.7964  ORF Unigene2580_Nuclearia_a/g.7964 Unigene2580_Nuclearia_a/m.7964 type:complete len:352 (+) Unigene2580_Nuclearia_a:641-1696(+)